MRAKPEEWSDSESFDFPAPPESIPLWARRGVEKWRGLRDFDIEVQAESLCPYQVEIRYVDLPASVWGFRVARKERARLCINRALPSLWRRFALFHELYHLISHSEGEHFWRQTFQPLSKFEGEADLFAWAAVWPEWSEGMSDE